ncbi:protein kinase C [Streptomyces viridosporus ATCC 14672]|uniref:Protein kinase C n=1 Tax=Streptomyces viridosporus (strain ATCC 14672 / DSM 40746 / JCM 4963 / KCTC 9882 / NRRL B-12104 / FH 1290) TaxID=566461 RepID=D5ZZ91_STRV1|nr:protein kinase C [Streptomyces viridosporus ATCC 14672]
MTVPGSLEIGHVRHSATNGPGRASFLQHGRATRVDHTDEQRGRAARTGTGGQDPRRDDAEFGRPVSQAAALQWVGTFRSTVDHGVRQAISRERMTCGR